MWHAWSHGLHTYSITLHYGYSVLAASGDFAVAFRNSHHVWYLLTSSGACNLGNDTKVGCLNSGKDKGFADHLSGGCCRNRGTCDPLLGVNSMTSLLLQELSSVELLCIQEVPVLMINQFLDFSQPGAHKCLSG